MSTFKGIIAEFPQIRVDYFRQQPKHKAPLACFLSHVHSDHLTGLESLRAPFVYCSAATREILLRLEKYHYRINFARGILESRNVTFGRSTRRLVKPLPLDTPTVIELSPENKIRVTLIDANHCVGAVMFLIEGDGKAILYTGDIRAEVWWVNSLVQNPVLLPYTLGSRRLDCIYLDTTFATKAQPYRKFPSKAEGLRELLEKVEEYPNDTVFYFHAWTFGYENVWVTLSSYLQSEIHLDEYRSSLYGSLSSLSNQRLRDSGLEIREAPALCGFRNGNHIQPGCLTSRSNVRLHSCERGTGCPVLDQDTAAKVVHIIPIVTRSNGTEIAELGAGGGKGDLDQKKELETSNDADVWKLMELCKTKIEDEQLQSDVLRLLQDALSNGKVDLGPGLQRDSQSDEDDLSLQGLLAVLSRQLAPSEPPQNRTIRFPYSRHSSYGELCAFVDAFRPRDVYPCTVDDENWSPALSMRNLFGGFCSTNVFRHDSEMMETYQLQLEAEQTMKREAETQASKVEPGSASSITTKRPRLESVSDIGSREDDLDTAEFVTPVQTPILTNSPNAVRVDDIESHTSYTVHPVPTLRAPPILAPTLDAPILLEPSLKPPSTTPSLVGPSPFPADPSTSVRSVLRTSGSLRHRKPKLTNSDIAYNAAAGFGLTWADYGGLVSTRTKMEQDELEL